MSSNGGHGSYGGNNHNGYGGNNHNGGQATPRPKVVHKNDKTNDKRSDKEYDTRYYEGSAYYDPKDTGRSNDSRYYRNSGRR